MINSYILIVLLSSLAFPETNSFYLGEKTLEKNGENSISTDLKKVHFRQNEEASRRASSRLFGNQESFIKCIFEFHATGKPEYNCDHSGDVKINWHEEKGRLIGIFTTNFDCPVKRDVIDRINRNENDGKAENWKNVRLEKRRTIFKDDADYKDSDEDEQVDEEESSAPENVRQALWDDDTEEESQTAEPPNTEEEAAAEATPEASIDDAENDKDKDVPGTVEETGEVDAAIESETSQTPEVSDPDVPPPETSPDVSDEKPESGVGASNTTDDDDEDDFEDGEAGVIIIEIELDQLFPSPEQILEFISDVGTIIADAGDYLISLVLGKVKRQLRIARIHERFDEKVEKLAKKYGGDTAKALRIMEKRIHNRLGKAFELEIIKMLKELRDGMKT